jgi:hypothetical protein
MQLIASDLLTEAQGLSIPFSVGGIVFGILLWVFGWRWHRFWIVLGTTTAAGIYGLYTQPEPGPRLLAAGLLLAVAAGLMALDLSRFIAFSSAGIGAWFIVHAVVPAFHEPLICFLAGGILGLFLYRLQMMLLFSFLGVLLTGYSILLLIETAGNQKFDGSQWAKTNFVGVNIAVVVLSLVGLAVQGQFDKWHRQRELRRKEKALLALSEAEREHIRNMPPQRWYDFLKKSA